MSSMSVMGTNKEFILRKYFDELQKYWATQQKLEDATSTGEQANIQSRLRNISSELSTLRSRLSQGGPETVDRMDTIKPSPSTPSLHTSHLTSVSGDEFSTLRSSRSVVTEQSLSLQHNYSNISLSQQQITPPSERQRRRDRSLAEEMKRSSLAEISDLIRLQGPLTEDAVVKTLQARFYNQKFQTYVGPILLSINPYNDVGNPITLNSTREAARTDLADDFYKVAQEAIRVQGETGYSQAIILSGACGSGKTYASMVLLRQLFDIAGGGPETDAFKHVAAAFSVLRSLGSAKTAANRESSRIGHFIEVQVSDGALYRTRLYCYSLDQSRVVRPLPTEKNYHIFYQMMAGLGPEERSALGLENLSILDLNYLNTGDTRTDVTQDRERFNTWKSNLVILGIPCMDVLKVMAAILLLGNLKFSEGNGLELELAGKEELRKIAGLLGVTPALLHQGLTSRTHNVRGHLVKSSSDANMANYTRDALAKALYCRTVATIVKRANSLKRPALSGSMSSNESVHHEVASLHASTVGTAGSKKSRQSLAILSQALRHATDGFIGILDMFGFEDSKPSQLEQLCINLCSETMQHFYNTHTLKTAIETCRDEGITCGLEVDYADNAHCIDLISSLRTGLLKMLDVECSVRGCPETYIQKVRVQQKENQRLFEPQHCHSDTTRMFGIYHYAGKVVYDTSDFLETNRDVIPDDLVSIFHKTSCNFGFATHLFGTEIKALYSEETVPRGVSFRISPTSSSDLLNGDEPVSTLTQDFHTRLDNLLRTLVKSKPHFIRCIRPNETEVSGEFSRSLVVQQVRSLQVLETVNLMAGGLPHRMRFKNFNSRYRLLAPIKTVSRQEEAVMEECQQILEHLRSELERGEESGSPVSRDWALGKKHVFLSEGSRQLLEKLRTDRRNYFATRLQAVWRGRRARRSWPTLRKSLQVSAGPRSGKSSRPRPQAMYSPPEDGSQSTGFFEKRITAAEKHNQDRCDFKTIQKTCALFGLDLERPPPIPASRAYTVTGNRKVSYPQSRVMRTSFPDEEVVLEAGEAVVVLGASTRRGHLVVERNNHTIHVPYQYLELRGHS